MSLSIIKRNLCVNSTVRKLGDRNSKTGDTFVPREYYWNLIPLLEKSKDYQNVIPLLEKSRNPKIYVSVIADWKSLVPQVFIVCKLTFFQMNKIHDRATSTYFWSQLNQLVSNSSKKGEWILSTNWGRNWQISLNAYYQLSVGQIECCPHTCHGVYQHLLQTRSFAKQSNLSSADSSRLSVFHPQKSQQRGTRGGHLVRFPNPLAFGSGLPKVRRDPV